VSTGAPAMKTDFTEHVTLNFGKVSVDARLRMIKGPLVHNPDELGHRWNTR
jgi:hypothetical protein